MAFKSYNSQTSFTDIKSHSSFLTNERISTLFNLIDIYSVEAQANPMNIPLVKYYYSLVYQLYKNIKPLITSSDVIRVRYNLSTKIQGVYIPDVIFSFLEKIIYYGDLNKKWTLRRIRVILKHLNNLEVLLRDVLQSLQYFFRLNYNQKIELSQATEKYKNMVDELTLNELKQIIGKNALINLDELDIEK